uniref:Uncharacterized protein n=1 Tax=Lepeophtheirus salmonis TaxID=72036 RepID=A0A0K2V9G5_LEPSM
MNHCSCKCVFVWIVISLLGFLILIDPLLFSHPVKEIENIDEYIVLLQLFYVPI